MNDQDAERYTRQMRLSEVGEKGQEALRRGKVLLVGTGGLGSATALYLAAAGVGTLGLADGDPVELSNLHRQILHFTPDLGKPKTVSAREKISALNPSVAVREHPRFQEGSSDFIADYDLAADCSDNFDTRYFVNDACVRAGIPLVSGAVLRWEGQMMTVQPGRSACYRCAFPEPPVPECVKTSAEVGILGPVAGAVGCLMASEVIKILLGLDVLSNRMLFLDVKNMSFRTRPLRRRPGCACGSKSDTS